MEYRLDELATRLRESGYRLTPQRLGVVRALVENDEHPSAEHVHQHQARLPTTSLATVYNTIALKEIGEVLGSRRGRSASTCGGPIGARFDLHRVCSSRGRAPRTGA
ncbi:MAG: transcriptional repressor [Chloroflexia bacterium]